MSSRERDRRERRTSSPAGPAPAGRTLSGGWSVWAAALVLVAAGILAYANCFSVPFHFDDKSVIEQNTALNDLFHPWRVFPARPVLGFSLALNYFISGTQVWSYHALNVAAHVLAALVLFGLVRRTLRSETLAARWGAPATAVALASALLWVVHPLQTQAVTYIIQRSESLMGLFYLLTVYCAVRAHGSGRGWRWWLAAGAALFLGLGVKPVIATAPVVVLLYYWTFFPGAIRAAVRQHKQLFWTLLALAGAAWLAGMSVIYWLSAHGTGGFGMTLVTPVDYALRQSEVLFRYLRLSFWPQGLCLDYGWQLSEPFGRLAPWAAGELLLLAATAWGLAHRHAWGFLGAWFFLILAPTSSLMPVADAVMEHRMYLPLAAVAVLALTALCAGGARLLALRGGAAQVRLVLRAAGWLLLAAGAAALAGATRARNEVYRTASGLWEDTVQKAPRNPRAWSNYGEALIEEGRPDKAVAPLQEAVKIKPDYAHAYVNLSTALRKAGRCDESLAAARKALEFKPDFLEARLAEGSALADGGHPAEAAERLEKVVEERPDLATARSDLGHAYEVQGQLPQAEAAFRRALELDPKNADAHRNQGVTLGKLSLAERAAGHADKGAELLERARQHLAEAVRLKPNYTEAYCDLGVALDLQGRIEEARENYERAIRLNPAYAQAYQHLGAYYEKKNHLRAALENFQKAVEIQPNYTQANMDAARVQARLATPPP